MLSRPIPYSSIEQHGVIGDRRTAALVAADGTIDWLCLPDYDGDIIFGALLDADRGGYWRLGPAVARQGSQAYLKNTAVLVTNWELDGSQLELTDIMAWPGDVRQGAQLGQRVLIRRLRSMNGPVDCIFDVVPRLNFSDAQVNASSPNTIAIRAGSHEIGVWISRAAEVMASGARSTFTLREGEEVWSALSFGEKPREWSVEEAADALDETNRYWQSWCGNLSYTGPRGVRICRSAMLMHLLSYSPAGSLVAAPTTSLPERLGGDWCADYRFAWLRDASLSFAILATLGNTADPLRYMDWLTSLDSSTEEPLQVLYGIRGETELPQRERDDLYGYRSSKPVRFQNNAYRQRQHDSLGYFNDCCYVYLEQDGDWKPEYWDLVRRIADYTAGHWQMADNGIWELPVQQQYVSGKVMSWVALDRAAKIAEKLGHSDSIECWRSVMDQIHAEVMASGWSDRLGAFKQRDEGENLDASALLISVMEFLSPDHSRVIATIERIAESLTIDGFVYRFDPTETPGLGEVFNSRNTFNNGTLALGEFEGAFLPCTFWLATAYAKADRPDEAEAIVDRVEALSGALGLFGEGVDPRTRAMMGNYPLLFSQIEYIRAVMEIAKARPLSAAKMTVSKLGQQVGKFLKQ